jgi:scyllo-inositol 2-dehydrogenase (NADP+)
MKIIVIGLGVQGNKRKKYFKKELMATVDPLNKLADYRDLDEVPDNLFDTAIVCAPDSKKYEIIKKLIKRKKNIFVEKPLFLNSVSELSNIERVAKKNNILIYTGYNHRFEPHFQNLKKLLDKNQIGKIYSCRLFYGNGTSALVKKSSWRDKNWGVIYDLAPHLIDLCLFWFGDSKKTFELIKSNNYENLSPDHAILNGEINNIFIQLEMTFCMWKNDFQCDILGEKGSIHISSLCKWGPSKLIIRKRKFPSGKPKEKVFTINKNDPTWDLEYQHFKKISKDRKINDLKRDKIILKNLLKINK